ncbi:MAG TPA: arginase family protein, partial [Thermoleophilaceae bacterium]|nr:arginase family protein [Thermoleophilaceae bacterium]
GHGPAAIVEQARCGPRGGEAAELGVPAGRGPRDHGPAQQMHPTGRHPLVEPEDVVILGLRPPSLHPDVALELERVPPAIARMSAVGISAAGALEVGARWERALRERGPAWLHLDLDVLDEASLPAVSYPQPLGLDWDDFVALARPLLRSPALVGASVADFNPDLDDPYGSYAGSIVRALQRAAG